MRLHGLAAAIAIALSLTSPSSLVARQSIAASQLTYIDISSHVREASQRFGIPEHWIFAVIRTESAGRVRAVSSAGAMGLMQLMPGTWARQRDRFGLGDDPFDPRDNILAGTSYLREMYDRYGLQGFLAAYNAGPGRYEQWRDKGRDLPLETRRYVATIAPLLKIERLFVAASVPSGRASSGDLAQARALPVHPLDGAENAAGVRPGIDPFPRPGEVTHDLFVPVSTVNDR